MRNELVLRLARWAGRKLPASQTIWLKRLRREEHPWQRKQRALRSLQPGRHVGTQNAPQHQHLAETTFTHRGTPMTVVDRGYDAHQAVSQNRTRTAEALRQHHVDWVQLPSITPFKPTPVISQTQVHEALRAIDALETTHGHTVRLEDDKQRQLSSAAARRTPEKIFRIVVLRHIVGPSGHLMSSPSEAIIIEPWRRLSESEDRADGGTHPGGTLLRRLPKRGPLVEYLTPDTWQQATQQATQHGSNTLEWQAPHLYQVTAPIDLVYTWVDGSDPEWLARKNRVQHGIDQGSLNDTALSDSRFTSRDELRYSLRSVEAYANWVNHIHIVTDGQVPAWLNTEHPRITVVDHQEIFSDPTVLPVFNSHAIESQLHHIEGLSEHYLYMNDDLFFMRPVRPELFFTGSGLSKFFPSRAPLDIHDISVEDLPVLQAAKRGRQFIREQHGRTVTNKFKHTPHPQLRSVLTEMEQQHPRLFRDVAASKFRAPTDYSIASSLSHFHAYATRRAVVGHLNYDYLDISSPRAALRLEWFSYQRKLDVVCLNDTHLDEADQPRVAGLLADFLERRFSVASSFERPGPTG